MKRSRRMSKIPIRERMGNHLIKMGTKMVLRSFPKGIRMMSLQTPLTAVDLDSRVTAAVMLEPILKWNQRLEAVIPMTATGRKNKFRRKETLRRGALPPMEMKTWTDPVTGERMTRPVR
jgi:hypothetical protein